MPIRQKLDPLVTRIGKRIHDLRSSRHLSLEDMTRGAALAGKGYLSQVERGLALPTLTTLANIAMSLGVDLIDLVNFTEQGPRSELVEATRGLGETDLQQLITLAQELRTRQPSAAAEPTTKTE